MPIGRLIEGRGEEGADVNSHSWHEERDERRPSGSKLILDV